jgi:hypothetical protein
MRLGLRLAVGILAAVAAVVPAPARADRLAPADRLAINRLLDRFVPSAVERRDPAASWRLATPAMRSGTTFRQWRGGDLPVYPYPARGARFHGYAIDYALPGDVAFELYIPPRAGARVDPISFSVEVKKIRGRWLVDSFYPAASFDTRDHRVVGPRDFVPGAVSNTSGNARLGTVWLAVPGALLAGILLVPLTLFAVGRARDRCAFAAARVRPYDEPATGPRSVEAGGTVGSDESVGRSLAANDSTATSS